MAERGHCLKNDNLKAHKSCLVLSCTITAALSFVFLHQKGWGASLCTLVFDMKMLHGTALSLYVEVLNILWIVTIIMIQSKSEK